MSKKKCLMLGSSAIVLILAAILIIALTGGSKKTDNPSDISTPGNIATANSIPDEDTKPSTAPVVDVPSIPDTKPATTPVTDIPKITDTKPDTTVSTATDTTVPATPNVVLDAEKGGDVEVNLSEIEKETTPPKPPAVKDEVQLTNPDKKPEYEETDTKIPQDSGTPKNGDKKDGKIYIEGFGWVDGDGGESKGEVVDSDGDINKQVGIMGGE